jgi:transcriptional regulator with XRE-family HTH domain
MKPLSLTHKRLGRRIKTLRKELDLTQEDLAFEVGVNRSYMGFIERGERNPSLAMLKKIAKALRVSLSVLFRSV